MLRQLKIILTKPLIRNVIIFSGGIIVFLAGVVVYGVVLNLREVTLSEAMRDKGIVKIDDPVIYINRSTYTVNFTRIQFLLNHTEHLLGKTFLSQKQKQTILQHLLVNTKYVQLILHMYIINF